MNTATLPSGDVAAARARAAQTALWLLMGVLGTLFTLFLAAYAMRMDSADWSPIALPPQLWLSSALLLASSVLLQRAARAAQALRQRETLQHLLAGGITAMAFLGAQLWAWQSLLDARVGLAGNPAASFFYLLTALHGLHVIGGLLAWSATVQAALSGPAEPRRLARQLQLCARYWHFLLAVWAVLFTAFGVLTPELVRMICGRA